MAIDCEYFPPSHDDELSRLKARIAELEAENDRLKEALHRLSCNADCCYRVQFKSTKRALWLDRAKKAEIWERYWEIKRSLLSHTFMYASKALFALEGYEEFPDTKFLHHTYRLADEWELVWKKVKHLCIKKAEEYK